MKKEEKTKAEQDMKELTEDELAGAAGGGSLSDIGFRTMSKEEREEFARQIFGSGSGTEAK